MNRLVILMVFVCFDAMAVEVKKASSPIRVDAVLDEPAWREATAIRVDREWFPGDNVDAVVTTEAFVTWDDENLYAAFRASDPSPGQIRARYAERDEALLDDNVGLLIDPFNDERIAYQFRVNPLGVQADAINSEVEGTEDFAWDAIWDSAGRITSDGYIVELTIPLQQLRIPGGMGRTWGFMAMRDYPRSVRHRFRSVVTDENRNCLLCQFGEVTGIGVTEIGRNVEVTPTLTANLQQDRGFPDERGIDFGVSGRWAMTPGTSLQATINPDFSHIEADAAQLDVNTRFALSYAERRPFFLEGADFFETQLPLVFTRTIADPQAGLKFTGKSGPHVYGVLVARDEITNFLIPSDDSSSTRFVSEPSTTAIARYRRSLTESATAGVLVSSRTGSGYSNNLLSGDAFVRVTERDSLRVQIAGSRSDYPSVIGGGSSLAGHTLLARYDHADRDWTWAAEYFEVAPRFRADSGLFNQVGVRSSEAGIERRVRGGPDRWFRNLYFEVSGDARQEWSGEWSEWGSDIVFTYQGRRQSYVSLLIAPNQEYFDGRTYHNLRYSIDSGLDVTDDLTLGLFVNWGENIDFGANRQAEFITIHPYATFYAGRRFSGSGSWVRQTFRTPEGSEIFTADIPQATLFYHFNRRAFLRAILQHRDVDRPLSRSESLLSQLLFSYRLDAQTVFLAGYSDNYSGSETIDLTQTNRAVFVKLSYAWLF
jgi:hypothetical protein